MDSKHSVCLSAILFVLYSSRGSSVFSCTRRAKDTELAAYEQETAAAVHGLINGLNIPSLEMVHGDMTYIYTT